MRALARLRLPVLLLLLPASALAQSHFRFSYEMAVPYGPTRDFIDRFSSRGAHLDGSLELSPAFHLELSLGWNLFNAAKQGTLTVSDGRQVSGQFRYLNAIPAMAGFAGHPLRGGGGSSSVPAPAGQSSSAWSTWACSSSRGPSGSGGDAADRHRLRPRQSRHRHLLQRTLGVLRRNEGAPKQSWFGIGVGFLFGAGRK
jgi:hypothetical protein